MKRAWLELEAQEENVAISKKQMASNLLRGCTESWPSRNSAWSHVREDARGGKKEQDKLCRPRIVCEARVESEHQQEPDDTALVRDPEEDDFWETVV